MVEPLRLIKIVIVLAGPGEPPSAALLADRLTDELDDEVELDLQWIPRNRTVVSSTAC